MLHFATAVELDNENVRVYIVSVFRIDDIRKSLQSQNLAFLPNEFRSGLAAVAMVLVGDDSHLQLCFIQRAEREGDPWSGHMAFPGGRASALDVSVQAAAEREAFEEVGLVLGASRLIGRLPDLPVHRAGVDTGILLCPFVYYLGPEPALLVTNQEVAGAYWIDLSDLWDERNRTKLDIHFNDSYMVFPAIRFRDQLIWGLTLRVLGSFADVIGQPLT
jgi:8-oxo-dGTP pyrophosphatase MutT (NUDIX family)